jgi:hypothetical protein
MSSQLLRHPGAEDALGHRMVQNMDADEGQQDVSYGIGHRYRSSIPS